MNTPSHLIINSAIIKKIGPKGIPRSAFLLGSVLPDNPLGLLTLGFYLYNRFILGQLSPGLMPKSFDDLFFNNPWWIGSHNFLHSPTTLFMYIAILWRFRLKAGTKMHWLFWFVAGCIIHTSIDILTHVTDGPLLFWPFDWHTRFQGIISYYDPAHFGAQFSVFEMILDVILLGYLLLPIIKNKLQKQQINRF